MLTTAPHTLRTRWTAFVGSFVALALGVALLTVTGLALAASLDAPARPPERFSASASATATATPHAPHPPATPVVVKAHDTLRVPTPTGDRLAHLPHPRPIPPTTLAKLKRLGPVTEDRTYPVRTHTPSGPRVLTGHPWPTARFAPYELTTGRAPRTATEVVVSDRHARVGDRLRTDHGTVRVVGTVAPLGFEDPVFHTPAHAAQLSPVSTQLVVEAPPSAVRAALRRDPVDVLTGDARRRADADPDRDTEALTALNALFGTAGGVSAFVSVFVVASTFAFAVAQRRREFGLLRTAGATPGQVRRTVVAEALLVGVLAAATGCALGSLAAPPLVERTVDAGLAPPWFRVGDAVWPYHAAFWTGLLVALCGVLAASWRAGRTGPAEALRTASVDARAMTRGRALCGTALLLTAAVTLAVALLTEPGDLLHRKTYVSRPMLLITAVALLAPLVVRPLTRLLTWLPARLPGATGLLVRENAATGVRRTAAVAAPVLVTVALTGSLLGATATLSAARVSEVREQTTADYVVTAATPLDQRTLHALRTTPGTRAVSPSAATAVHVLEDDVALIRSEARAADPAGLAATIRLPVAAGRATDLDDESIIVNEEWARHRVGQHVDVWLGDGTRRSLRIAAVLRTGTGDNGVYVTPANAPGAAPDRVDVSLAPGADPATVAAGLRAALRDSGARLLPREEWATANRPGTGNPGTTRLGLLLVLGIALLYTGVSVANTMAMATADRVRDLTALRLVGAARGQVLRLLCAETLTVVTVGALLGLLTAVLNLLGMSAALATLSVPTPPRLPWQALGATTAACAVLAVFATLAPAALALRRSGAAT
ncbi:FtsX-like permease family protein [Streptomyces sp. NPDC006997]|uniref:ABC transporter permease n=1 Tax=Streptomyces sp. NPDC006997 TaxID=3155356 RepID=UPI0033FAFE52